MSAFTNFAENKLVDALFRGQALGAPATHYLALIVASRGYSNVIRGAAVLAGDTVIPTVPNGHLYRCTTPGTTAGTDPVWPTGSGATVTDGTAVWTEATPDLEAGTNLVEVTGGGYARASLASSLANFAGTQAAGSTTASTGTSGTTSNNAQITFPAPTAYWGVVAAVVTYDQASGGNPWTFEILTAPKTINADDDPAYVGVGAFTFQVDN